MSTTGKTAHNFDNDANWFIREISSRKRVLPTFAHACKTITDKADKDLQKLIDVHGSEKIYDDKGRLESFVIDESYVKRHTILRRAFDDFSIFTVSLPKMAIVSVISLFDAYLAKILRNAYKVRPELLNSCTRQISFTELTSFGSIENAREHIIEKEIETLLRDSHVAQFEWLTKRLDVKLTELPSWKIFVELTERRNLLVHADGRVSAHYIDVCQKHGIKLQDDIKPGTRLLISADYYRAACDCVAEIGIKLGQVVWRKLIPTELEQAELSFIDISYDILAQHDYILAEQVLNLSREKAFKKMNAESGYYMSINLAISLKGQEKTKELKQLLSSLDFSALASKFKLASHVLNEEHAKAGALMIKMGVNDDITEHDYRNWPLFRWFRKTDEFKDAFREVFGKEFVIIKETFNPYEEEADSDLDDENSEENSEHLSVTPSPSVETQREDEDEISGEEATTTDDMATAEKTASVIDKPVLA